jgi:hypothetical protein
MGDGGAPETFMRIAELKTLSGPKISTDALETTVHNSASPTRRYVPGLINFGDVSTTLNFNPKEPTHGASGGLTYIIATRACRNFQIVFPDPTQTTWAFSAFITSFDVTADPAALLMASCTFKIAGNLVIA